MINKKILIDRLITVGFITLMLGGMFPLFKDIQDQYHHRQKINSEKENEKALFLVSHRKDFLKENASMEQVINDFYECKKDKYNTDKYCLNRNKNYDEKYYALERYLYANYLHFEYIDRKYSQY